MLAFGWDPINLSGYPPLEFIKWLFWFFKESFEERGENTELFDNPEITVGNNTDLVKTLNRKLE